MTTTTKVVFPESDYKNTYLPVQAAEQTFELSGLVKYSFTTQPAVSKKAGVKSANRFLVTLSLSLTPENRAAYTAVINLILAAEDAAFQAGIESPEDLEYSRIASSFKEIKSEASGAVIGYEVTAYTTYAPNFILKRGERATMRFKVKPVCKVLKSSDPKAMAVAVKGGIGAYFNLLGASQGGAA